MQLLSLKTPLKGHQVEARDHLINNTVAGLNHPMGSGKSLAALSAAIEVMREDDDIRTLILAPKRVCTTWMDQISRHINGASTYLAIDKKKAQNVSRTARFVIASYHSCEHLPVDLNCVVVIADECHTFRNPNTKLFGRVKVWASTAAWFWGLSGTHIVNKVADGRALQLVAESREKAQIHHLSAAVKKELLDSLPPLKIDFYELEFSDEEEPEFEAIKTSHHHHLTVMTWQLMYAASCPTKMGGLLDLIEKHPGDNFIIFSRFVSVRDTVMEFLAGEGGVTDDFRTFQRSGGLLVTSYKSFGVGIDCSMAHHVVFLDLPWTAADFDQAVARAHRPGNERCNVHVFVFPKTPELRVLQIIDDKRALQW